MIPVVMHIVCAEDDCGRSMDRIDVNMSSRTIRTKPSTIKRWPLFCMAKTVSYAKVMLDVNSKGRTNMYT